MADVAASLADWNTTAFLNLPNDNTAVGTGLADNLQQIQASVRAGLAFKGLDIASGATVDLSTATGSRIDVTHSAGTTAISSFGVLSAGIWKLVKFVVTGGALTVTHNATSLKLPNGASINVVNGDVMFLSSLGSGNWECLFYQTTQKTAQQVADEVYPLMPRDIPIGGYVIATQTNEPDPRYFIRLKAGLTGVGQYNEGKLTSESVSGSAPLITATAVVTVAGSPFNGNSVGLLEDERRFFRAGSPGTLQDDALQNITGTFGTAMFFGGSGHGTGAFSASGGSTSLFSGGASGNSKDISFDASSVARTANETRSRNIGVAVYMRIK